MEISVLQITINENPDRRIDARGDGVNAHLFIDCGPGTPCVSIHAHPAKGKTGSQRLLAFAEELAVAAGALVYAEEQTNEAAE